jgi:hypothetical protein
MTVMPLAERPEGQVMGERGPAEQCGAHNIPSTHGTTKKKDECDDENRTRSRGERGKGNTPIRIPPRLRASA